jgi:hypothetical protein
VVTRVGNLNYVRVTGQFTLLPDGSVLASGGSLNFNDLSTAVYQSEIYSPSTGTWTLDATAAVPRLYHNSALLLPDGSVLTAGGGAPGPVNELNAEIYYPPYLYLQDGSGNPAPRPTIVSAPSALTLNQSFLVTVGANDRIGKINLIRVGADTHDFDSEQRLIPLPYTQSGTQITATLSASPQLAPPGYYMLFAFNRAGVPAVAKIISVGLSDPASYDFGGMYGYGYRVTYTNPATGAASCPSGYTARAALGSSGVDWPLYFCYRTHVNGKDPIYDFGGMYGYGNGTNRYPNNAYTNPATGAASCPSGYTARAALGSSGVDWPLYFCYRTHVSGRNPTYDFGGMYGYGNGTARYPNNAYTNPATGAASCPSGYTARAVLGRSGVDWPLYFCYR